MSTYFSDDARDLISRMLTTDPKKRITVSGAYISFFSPKDWRKWVASAMANFHQTQNLCTDEGSVKASFLHKRG